MTDAAYELNGVPCTRERFYAVACDPRRSVVVEACAGAGKTWMLVSRILRALLEPADGRPGSPSVAPQDILAITFTRKAAGEMRQRLHEWLEQFAHAAPEQLQQELIDRGLSPESAQDKRALLQNLYQTLLDHGRSVQIRTFHSWFAALLRTAPLSLLDRLGLPAQHELLEDEADALQELWRRFLRGLVQDEALRADYTALVRSMGRFNVHEALNAALAKRVEFTRADAAGVLAGAVPTAADYFPGLAGFAEPRDALVVSERGRSLLREAGQAMLPGPPTQAAQGQKLLLALQGADPAQTWADVTSTLLTQKGEPRKFSAKLAGLPTIQAAQDEVLTVLTAERQQAGHVFHERMARLSRRLIAEFADLKRERGWVDMGDLETAAQALLADPVLSGWVQERLDSRVRQLLIDEFQDTNPLQWQALHAWLSGYAGAGGGAGGLGVFIVGDPKQSIYRFRRADPKVFAAARNFVRDALGGDALSSDHTRRNAPALIGAVNTVLGQAQQAGQFAGFRPHSTESSVAGQLWTLPVIPRPPNAAADGGADQADLPPWRDTLTTPREELEETLRTLECRQAARWIAAQVAAGAAPRSFMVLCRRRAPLSLLQRELRVLNIAADQPEAQSLGELPAAQDLVALIDALVSPGHDLALARALKSPLFGLTDAQLASIAQAARGADGQARPWLGVLQNKELPALEFLAPAADLIQYQAWLQQLPPHDALQAIFHHRDVLARYAAAAPAAERGHHVLQLRALLSAALQVGGGRFLTAYQLVRALRQQTLPVPRPVSPHAVQLLTVHGAKGLEADTVLLLDTQSGPRAARGLSVLIDWPGEAVAPCSFVFLASESKPPPSAQNLLATEQAEREREELNALYVAMTRAKRQLAISSFEPHRASTGTWWQRIEPLCQPADMAAANAAAASALNVAATDPRAISWPDLPPAPVDVSSDAIKIIVFNPAQQAAAIEAADTSRVGEAMHWLLEHAGDTPQGWLPQRLAQARRRWGLTEALATQAERLARRILDGEAAWAWSADEVLQAFNEVELTHLGQRLRIDRLVRRRATGTEPECWWVLDYKSAAHPERDPELVAQLVRYREAVQRLHPGEVVRVGFLTGKGEISGL